MSSDEFMARLFYIATSILGLSVNDFWLTTVGEIITLFNLSKIMNGDCKKMSEITIDDVIPI